MKRLFIFSIITLLALAACGGQSIEQAIVGKWVASGTDEAFNTYEFFDDGTGLLSTADGSFNVDFTYSFTGEDAMLMNVDDRGDVSVQLTMPDEGRLTFRPETSNEPINLRLAEE